MWDSPENSFAFRAARFLAGSRGALDENGISHFGCGQEMELARRIKSCRCLAGNGEGILNTYAIEQEIAAHEKQLRQSYSVKAWLMDDIDSLD